ncbi:MAG: hypothetical protein J2P28_27040, partial [Actinobacteria bacterium]|nr:hypothetical protein [Actinomycetota bacterium]
MTSFRVWAPGAGRVSVEAAGTSHPMLPDGRPGWWIASVDDGPRRPAAGGLPAPVDYAFRLDGGEPLPDPRSLRQPSGPSGFSQTYD